MSQESNFNNLDVNAANELEAFPKEKITPKITQKITVWGEIGKAWHWVVFIWKMAGSFGGIRSLLSSIKGTLVMLIKRLLIQLQTSPVRK